MESRKLQVDGYELCCPFGGKYSNPAIVILQGLGMRPELYAQLGDLLSGEYFVLIPDLRGLGMENEVKSSEFKGLSRFLEGVLKKVGVSGATLIGHSLGGGVAIETAIRYPKSVKKLVLVSSMGEGNSKSLLGWVIAAFAKTVRSLGGGNLKGVIGIVSSFALSFLRHPKWMWVFFRWATRTELVTVLKSIQHKTYLVWAERDEYYPSCQKMGLALNTQPITIAQSGHDWIILEPVAASNILKLLL